MFNRIIIFQQIMYSEGDVLGEEDESDDGFQMLSGAAAGEGEDAMSLTSVPRSRRKIEFSIVLTKTDHLSQLDLVEVRTILCCCCVISCHLIHTIMTGLFTSIYRFI